MVAEGDLVTSQEPPAGVKGRKRFVSAFGVLVIPLLLFGVVRVAMKLQEAFQNSADRGWHLVQVFLIVLIAVVIFYLLLTGVLELMMRSRARFAAETTDLMPMILGVKSYEQAFWVKGRPVFWSSKHATLYLSVSRDAIEIYTGVRKYRAPIMTIRFADIVQISRAVVDLPVGRTPGVVFHCINGDFELGHIRFVALYGKKISSAEAQHRYEKVETALLKWKANHVE